MVISVVFFGWVCYRVYMGCECVGWLFWLINWCCSWYCWVCYWFVSCDLGWSGRCLWLKWVGSFCRWLVLMGYYFGSRLSFEWLFLYLLRESEWFRLWLDLWLLLWFCSVCVFVGLVWYCVFWFYWIVFVGFLVLWYCFCCEICVVWLVCEMRFVVIIYWVCWCGEGFGWCWLWWCCVWLFDGIDCLCWVFEVLDGWCVWSWF